MLKKGLAVAVILLFIGLALVPSTISTLNDIDNIETTFDDFRTIKTYIIGKFNTIEFEFKFGRKHVNLTCDKGDILLFGLGLKWNENFGWIPTRFTYWDATIVDLPRFGGIIFPRHIIGSSHGEVTWIG